MPATEIPKAYEPKAVEEKWYADWLAKNHFTANPNSSKPAYSIVIPPPNVTGVLTMGHVLNNTLQDILARRKRMQGYEVLWLPGTDHAGIATQAVVEKTLKKQGVMKHRDDLGREKFLERVWEWKEKHGGIIIQQLKKLGCSCDWTRERFTMDEAYSRCVLQVFVDLFNKKDAKGRGFIYRGKRMVNWDPAARTALSDEEVIMKEQRNDFLYYFDVEVVESDGRPVVGTTGQRVFLTIATTRPETIPGDTAVAVNPKDTRYQPLKSLYVVRPLPVELPREKKLIPIIEDDHVDLEFGTGALKVTPAHDKADWEIGERHNLPVVDIMNSDGSMNELAGTDLKGLDRFEARKIAVEKLKEIKALTAISEYQHNVGYSERTDVPIESRLSEQWFLRYPQVPRSTDAVEKSEIAFYPERWTRTYTHWMHNLRDWCISRQLWWGHRIPVWYDPVAWRELLNLRLQRLDTRSVIREHLEPSIKVQVDRPADPPRDDNRWALVEEDGQYWHQDPDVLDTWFSSWLWPFATMNWTGDKVKDAENPTLKKFYPTTDLVTGPDIIFFWVARMIMAGYQYMDEKPFSNVYFTGIIRDAQGRKMSKSLGNSPDPLDLIAKYGADGLRFGLMLIAPQGQDILFDEKRCEVGRNFMNKLWNAARFIQMQRAAVAGVAAAVPGGKVLPGASGTDAATTTKLTAHDLKILFEMNDAIAKVTAALDAYKFNEAAKELYDFVWGDFCDWYIEASKVSANIEVLDEVFNVVLRLLHPFAPFITEELWRGEGTIQFAAWPQSHRADYVTSELVTRVSDMYAVVGVGRLMRSEYRIDPKQKVKIVLKPTTSADSDFLHAESSFLSKALNASELLIDPTFVSTGATPGYVAKMAVVHIADAGDPIAEKKRLQKALQDLNIQLATTTAKLANKNFVAKAAPIAVQRERDRQQQLREQLEKVQALLKALG